MMIKKYPASDRYFADHGWLKSRFSFSFAEYHDPTNMQFGPLRVLNDDIVAPMRGFGAHPHREMEIVSIVLKGQLKHEDSTGISAVTTFGGVQRMTAGTGVVHSEVNPSPTEEVHFLQLWFLPERSGLTPSYGKTEFNVAQLKNQFLPIVSTNSGENIAHIHQDLTIYLSELEAGKELMFQQDENRRIFLFVIEGEISLGDGTSLGKRDSARITELQQIIVATQTGATFMLIDLP